MFCELRNGPPIFLRAVGEPKGKVGHAQTVRQKVPLPVVVDGLAAAGTLGLVLGWIFGTSNYIILISKLIHHECVIHAH